MHTIGSLSDLRGAKDCTSKRVTQAGRKGGADPEGLPEQDVRGSEERANDDVEDVVPAKGNTGDADGSSPKEGEAEEGRAGDRTMKAVGVKALDEQDEGSHKAGSGGVP